MQMLPNPRENGSHTLILLSSGHLKHWEYTDQQRKTRQQNAKQKKANAAASNGTVGGAAEATRHVQPSSWPTHISL
jgi:hypothetical protein